MLDPFGVSKVGPWGAFLWALSSVVTALATGFGGLFAARLLLDVAEAPGLAASTRATGHWFPRAERAPVRAIYDASAKFANVIGVPLIAIAVLTFGWRWGFALSAFLCLAYFLGFCAIYRDPSRDTKLQANELVYVRDGAATPEGGVGSSDGGAAVRSSNHSSSRPPGSSKPPAWRSGRSNAKRVTSRFRWPDS